MKLCKQACAGPWRPRQCLLRDPLVAALGMNTAVWIQAEATLAAEYAAARAGAR